MEQTPARKLYRSRTNRVIAGVCGGLGEYFNIDPVVFRVLLTLLLVPGGAGFWIYLVLLIVIPDAPLEGQSSQSAYGAKDFAQDMRQGANNLAQEIRNNGWRHDSRNLIGAIVVLVGILFLLNNIFPIPLFHWDFIWPVIIIIIGVMIIAKRR